MYGRVVALMGLALCGVLVGCSSSPSIPKHEPGPGPAPPITVHAGTLASWTSLIEAAVPIKRAGTYRYYLAYADVPPQPGAQPQACLPEGGFRLTSDSGTTSFLKPAATGSVELTAGRWTASSGYLGLGKLTVIVPPPPAGAFWSGACPWSLTLTPAS